MIEWVRQAVATLAARISALEARPFNPYSPDAEIFDHFAGDGTIDSRWTVTLAALGAVTIPNTTPTVARLTTGGNANGVARLSWGSNYSLVGANNYAEQVARWALTTAPITTSVCTSQFITAAGDLMRIGVIGSNSTAFFTAQTTSGGATTTTTTVAIDTAQHLFGIQLLPDRVRFFIDNERVAEHLTNFSTSPVHPRLDANNGATATAQTMDADFIWVREAR